VELPVGHLHWPSECRAGRRQRRARELPDSDDGRRLARIIGHPDIAFVRNLVEGDIQALLYAGDEVAADRLRRRLAARDGPLVPLIGERESGGYDLYRLVLEKTVTVNTTAAGGNAALMSLPG
jgi:RHH-type transcriptional regulator, proline utilization regulon repressor / proline dehydrogenase / delta 1-pyrroline-5-carboxylate dehydrogenase